MRLNFHFTRGAFAVVLLAGLINSRTSAGDDNATPATGLHFVTAPALALQYAKDALPKVGGYNADAVVDPKLAMSPPLAMYSLDVVAPFLTTGNLDAEAKLRSYDYFVKTSGKLARWVSVHVSATGQPVRPVNTWMNPQPNVSDGLDEVGKLLQVKMGSYEVRGLSCLFNGESITVLWLKSAPGGTDLIYPAMAWPSQYEEVGVKNGVLHTWPVFFAHLQAAALNAQAKPRFGGGN